MRVLVVDEDRNNAEVISRVLKDYDVVWANSVTRGMSEVDQGIDILFINTKNINTNSEILTSSIHKNKDSTVVLLAADNSKVSEEFFARLGASHVLNIPVNTLDVKAVTQWNEKMRTEGHSPDRKARVLVVDDDDSQCLVVNEMLKNDFYVLSVNSPNEAFKLLRKKSFDIVLTDFVMNEMSGVEFINAAKLNHPGLISVVMTAYSNRSRAISSIKEGVFDYLEKPLNNEELVSTLKRAWRIVNARNRQSKLIFDLEKSNILLEQKYSEMELAEARQKKAVEQAEQAIRDKAMFMSNVSHELGNSLNLIIGFSRALTMERSTPLTEDQEESVHFILKAGLHLQRLINDILDMSSIDSKEVSLEIESISLSDFLDDKAALLQQTISNPDIGLVYDLCDNLPSVCVDQVRLEQVIINLISNASKYHKPEGGVITVRTEFTDSDYVKVFVEDNGIGIPASKQPKLFVPFERLGAETSEIEGSGLGLCICKSLVELMGGKFGFQSTEGKGSMFWFTVPVAI